MNANRTEKHPIAVLRKILGMTQVEFANLIGCSPATIQSIEVKNGRLSLSHHLATKISAETGVGMVWLAAGDPTAPPTDMMNQPYVKATYERVQAEKTPMFAGNYYAIWETFCWMIPEIARVLLAANEKEQLRFARYRLMVFLSGEMRKQFPGYESFAEDLTKTLEAHPIEKDPLSGVEQVLNRVLGQVHELLTYTPEFTAEWKKRTAENEAKAKRKVRPEAAKKTRGDAKKMRPTHAVEGFSDEISIQLKNPNNSEQKIRKAS